MFVTIPMYNYPFLVNVLQTFIYVPLTFLYARIDLCLLDICIDIRIDMGRQISMCRSL